jgi:hypothetical protein
VLNNSNINIHSLLNIIQNLKVKINFKIKHYATYDKFNNTIYIRGTIVNIAIVDTLATKIINYKSNVYNNYISLYPHKSITITNNIMNILYNKK